MDKLRFGTAGIPLSTPNHNTINGIRYVRKLGLECMELEFVRQINISPQLAPQVKKVAQDNDVELTCHGQYYINLNSLEEEKQQASMKRVYQAAKVASLCGAKSMTFHAAYYLGAEKEKVFQKVKESLELISAKLREEGEQIIIRPETTGKATQWGDLPEIIKMSQEVEDVLPCIDFSHLHARSGGKNNTYAEFRQMLELVEKGLGREALDNMHIHLSGINYTAKGERNHLILKESDMNYKDLLKVWKEFRIKGCVISESPNIEEDALLLKREWEK